MSNQEIIEVLEHLDKHIIYDANLKEICYSAELIKVKEQLLRRLKVEEINLYDWEGKR